MDISNEFFKQFIINAMKEINDYGEINKDYLHRLILASILAVEEYKRIIKE